MIKIIIPISSLFFAISLLAIGYGLLMSLVGVRLKEGGVSDFNIGIISSLFFLGGILASLVSQKIISRVGHIRAFSAFSALLVLTFLLHPIYFNEIFWGELRFISGFAYYSLLIAIESWLNEKSSSEHRGKILAIYTIVFYLSTAIGQLFLSFDSTFRDNLFVLGSIMVLFSLISVALTKIKEPILSAVESYSFPKLHSIVPLALAGSFVGGLIVGAFFTMMPIYLLAISSSLEFLSTFMICAIVGGLVSQWPIGVLSDRYGRRKAIFVVGIWISITSSIAVLSFYFFRDSETLQYILALSLGSALFSLYPLSLARANDVLEEGSDIIEVSRSLLFVYGFGSFLAPIIVGLFFLYIDYYMIFVLFGVSSIILAIYALTKDRVPNEKLSVYVSYPSTYGTTLPEIDPRLEQEWVDERKPDFKDDKSGSGNSS